MPTETSEGEEVDRLRAECVILRRHLAALESECASAYANLTSVQERSKDQMELIRAFRAMLRKVVASTGPETLAEATKFIEETAGR